MKIIDIDSTRIIQYWFGTETSRLVPFWCRYCIMVVVLLVCCCRHSRTFLFLSSSVLFVILAMSVCCVSNCETVMGISHDAPQLVLSFGSLLCFFHFCVCFLSSIWCILLYLSSLLASVFLESVWYAEARESGMFVLWEESNEEYIQ